MSNNDKLQLANSFTSNPEQPGLDPEYHRGWFVRQAVFGKFLHYWAPEAELTHILEQWLDFFYSTAETEEQFLREKERILSVSWPWLKPRLEHNRGLVKFMREYGVYSRHFVPLLTCVPGALALCPAHGECIDIFGKPQRIPKWDKLYQFIHKDEMYAFARLRAEDAKSALEKVGRAMIWGAGTLQEVRQLQRFSLERLKQHDTPWLVAYDTDTRLQDYYAAVLEYPLDCYGVEFCYDDFRSAVTKLEHRGKFDLLGAWGLASYYDDELEQFLSDMKMMLAPGGIIKFDVQVLDGGSKLKKRFWQHTLVFDKVILCWESNMKPRKSIDDAIQYVETICASIGLKVDYYKYDPRNQIGVIFQCSRR